MITPPPTPEQAEAVVQFQTGEAMKMIAFAGAGKTSTLMLMARYAPAKRGMMMCFNKSIAMEAAQKFPRHVTCKTAHSLAYGTVVKQGFNPETKMMRAPRSRTFDVSCVRDKIPFHADIFRTIVATTIQRFCQSDATEITESHVPRIPGFNDEDQEFAYNWAPVAAAAVWSRMIDVGDDMPMGHDGYVKLWALGNPRLFGDFIMVDEAQDLNPVLIGIIKRQQAQIIAVGDSHQQIYEWRGARDALVILPGRECRLTTSFRFGDAIAAAASRVLDAMGERFPLFGFPLICDQVMSAGAGTPDAVLCRSNAAVISEAIGHMDEGRTVATPGGTGEMRALVEDVEALRQHRPARSPSLMGFTTWQEVEKHSETDEGRSLRVFVQLVGKYGCTTLKRVLDQILPYEKGRLPPGTVTISTAHKAKGLEWPCVAINEDFFASDDEEAEISTAERRLFYVAITRAQRTLCVDPSVLDAFSRPNEE
jgi:ABC-type cobalamin/Fe3+-siderophores transport system ATPase subunit